MNEYKKIINQSNINEPNIMQKINNLYAKNELGKLMVLYIKDTVSKGNSIFEEVFNYLFEMNFISREYLQGICSFIKDMATLDWIMLIDTISKTKESEDIINFVKEMHYAFKNRVDIKMVEEWATLADSPYVLHVMIDEYIGLNAIKKEYDNVMTSMDSVLNKLQQKEEAIQDITNKLQQKEEDVQDITNKLQQKEEEKKQLEEQLTESEKRKEYYKTSYEEACKKLDIICDESSKLKLKLSTVKISQEMDNQRHEEQKPSETQSYDGMEEMYKELLSKIESINEAILCMSDNTNQLLTKGFDEVFKHIERQLQEQFSNNNHFTNEKITDKEENVDEYSNKDAKSPENTTENQFFSPFDDEEQPVEVDIREEGEHDFYGVPPEYAEHMGNESDVDQYLEQEETRDNQEDIAKESVITDTYNESDLPSNEDITNATDMLQPGVQTHKMNATENIEKNHSFFSKAKQGIDIRKKVKSFNKVEDDTKKRQMILEEAMANKLDTKIVQGLKQLSMSNIVSLEFIYTMACDKNTSMSDILKLVEYTTA